MLLFYNTVFESVTFSEMHLVSIYAIFKFELACIGVFSSDKQRALDFLKTRTSDNLIIKLQRPLTEKEASKVFQEFIDANRASGFLFVNEICLPAQKGQIIHE